IISVSKSVFLPDINECSNGNHVCDVNANCTNTRGSHDCTCKKGYVGNGTSCQAEECLNYSSLTSANRKSTIPLAGSPLCDNSISLGWYRFQGAAGTKMPTTCPPTHRCGAHITSWLDGVHSTVAEGQVTRNVCFHLYSNCCRWSTSIKVRNCGSYYVYYFSVVPVCYARYCSTD
ncbi:uromodulin-like, partial [Stylophora pistillata]|uniref:uromodulin-like n=1 Tax=Stylophora pistillata TaxID=50429 RepID=UPI000C052FA3